MVKGDKGEGGGRLRKDRNDRGRAAGMGEWVRNRAWGLMRRVEIEAPRFATRKARKGPQGNTFISRSCF